MKLAKTQIISSKQLNADVRNLLFKIFEEGYNKMHLDKKVEFKK